jgi:cellulase/cellobiase CelA1
MQVAAGDTALKGWIVEFDAAFAITNIWNAQIVSHVGNHYVIKNMSYNGTVGAHQETSFGFQATPGSDGTAATGFTLNGISSGSGTPASATVLPSPSISEAARAEGTSGADLEALMSVVDSWNGGFNAAVTIHNDGGAISGWQLEIETHSEITSIWNAEIVSHDASGYVVRNAAWNGKVDAEAEVSFGFTATGSAEPSRFDFLI